MDPMNLLVVERGADWAHWSSTSHLVGHAMLVLAQQGDEPHSAFRQRIRTKLSRLKKQGLQSVVLLRGSGESQRSGDRLMRELLQGGPADFRVFPAAASAAVAALAMHGTRAQRSSQLLETELA
jgi:hypothetical protein